MDPESTIHSDNENSSSKKKIKSGLDTHSKRRLFEYLLTNGCTHATLESYTKTKKKKQEMIDYVCCSSENAALLIKSECDSVSVNNINQWLEMLKATGVSSLCAYEAAAVMNAIVRNEAQPEPEQMGGVDLREVYNFMEKALLGQPQKKLSAKSAEFLSREFELLIDEANSDKSDQAATQMGASLFHRQFKYDFEAAAQKCSLDPFVLDEESVFK